MSKCTLHPGRDSVTTVFSKNYCAACGDGITAARGRVDRHVQPRECFIWYVSNDKWQPISGTGCAHWVSHQLNITTGGSGDRCLGGFTYRVRSLVRSRTAVPNISNVQVNDIWASPSLDHTGLVIRIAPPAKAGGSPVLTIRHDSSRQGGVAENDFATYFHGQGSFYR
ncbi:MAG: hypothetical protein ACKV2U_05445 [Bryobacteraceae bacterium]